MCGCKVMQKVNRITHVLLCLLDQRAPLLGPTWPKLLQFLSSSWVQIGVSGSGWGIHADSFLCTLFSLWQWVSKDAPSPGTSLSGILALKLSHPTVNLGWCCISSRMHQKWCCVTSKTGFWEASQLSHWPLNIWSGEVSYHITRLSIQRPPYCKEAQANHLERK